MLLSCARMLELSIAASQYPDQHAHRERELAHVGYARRKVGHQVLAFADSSPENAARVLDRLARLRGHRYLAAGYESSAYLEPTTQTVVKIHRESAGRPPEELQRVADRKYTDHALLRAYLGGTVLAQQVKIAEHVLGGGISTVQVHQRFVPFTGDVSPFTTDTPAIDMEHLEQLVRSCSGVEDALRELVDRSYDMFDREVALPDTNGPNNIVPQSDGSLILIDTTPIGPEHAGVQALIIEQLGSMERGLAELGV